MIFGVLCSGSLGFNVLSCLSDEISIKFVFTDKRSTGIIDFCRSINIPVFIGNPRDGRASKFIEEHKLQEKIVDVIISVNYLFIVDNIILKLCSKLAFNVHGSLLPKYRGRTPHVWSIINNEKVTGITAHQIDEGCDTGHIIEQIKIKISAKDTGATLLEKYNELYLPLIRSVLELIKGGEIRFKKQNNSMATYFGKRTPDDGIIDWNWQKERIYNWVRAQAEPYPGAFTYFKGRKFVIDEVRFSNCGFDYSTENGKIISLEPLIVKVPNGCLEIKRFRGELSNLEINGVFK